MALGGAFVTWAKVAAEDFAVTKGEIKICEKTPGIKRGFCGDCGTTLTYAAEHDVEGQDWRADAWFAAATLDDPSIASPKSHVYVSQQQPWIKLADELPGIWTGRFAASSDKRSTPRPMVAKPMSKSRARSAPSFVN